MATISNDRGSWTFLPIKGTHDQRIIDSGTFPMRDLGVIQCEFAYEDRWGPSYVYVTPDGVRHGSAATAQLHVAGAAA